MKIKRKKLLDHTEMLVRNEKEFTFKIVKNLVEIDKYRLYVELGFNSLFSYCRDHLKYSDQEAMIRVNAVRLIKSNKLAEVKLEKREISLTVAADLFVNIKKYNEGNSVKLTDEQKNKLVGHVCNQSSRASKKIIQEKLNLVPELKCEVKLKKATVERLEKLKEKLAIHDIDLLLNALMQEKEDTLKKERVVRAQLSPTVKQSRYIPLKVKRSLMKKAGYQCQFVGQNGEKCESRVHLQVEHIRPYSLGGSNRENNLEILCFSHNQYNGVKIFGPRLAGRHHSTGNAGD